MLALRLDLFMLLYEWIQESHAILLLPHSQKYYWLCRERLYIMYEMTEY